MCLTYNILQLRAVGASDCGHCIFYKPKTVTQCTQTLLSSLFNFQNIRWLPSATKHLNASQKILANFEWLFPKYITISLHLRDIARALLIRIGIRKNCWRYNISFKMFSFNVFHKPLFAGRKMCMIFLPFTWHVTIILTIASHGFARRNVLALIQPFIVPPLQDVLILTSFSHHFTVIWIVETNYFSNSFVTCHSLAENCYCTTIISYIRSYTCDKSDFQLPCLL